MVVRILSEPDASLNFDAKAVPPAAYVAYGTEYRSEASCKPVEACCQKVRSREAGQCESGHTACCAC